MRNAPAICSSCQRLVSSLVWNWGIRWSLFGLPSLPFATFKEEEAATVTVAVDDIVKLLRKVEIDLIPKMILDREAGTIRKTLAMVEACK